MFCPNCHRESNGNYCTWCGAPLSAYAPPNPPPYYGYPQPPKKNHTVAIVVGCVAGAVVLLGLLAVLVFFFLNLQPQNNRFSVQEGSGFEMPYEEEEESSIPGTFGNYDENQVPDSYVAEEGTLKGCTLYPEGGYLVGADLPAGDYLLTTTSTRDSSMVYAYFSSTGDFSQPETTYYFANRGYVALNFGDYVYFQGCTATPAADAPGYEPAGDSYPGGMYLVGKDLEPGEYFLTGESFSAYLYQSPTVTSDQDYVGSTFSNRAYITLKEGQYFELLGGTAVPVKKATPYEPEGNSYPSGMYLVGVDLPAGEYEALATGSNASIAVLEDSSYQPDSILSSQSASEVDTITLEKGQYVVLYEMKLQALS